MRIYLLLLLLFINMGTLLKSCKVPILR